MITKNMEREEIADLFARASRIDKTKMGYMTQAEWENATRRDGATIFKRKALGLCGRRTVKTLDGMAQLLYSTGVASSLEEGEEIVPQLVGKEIDYGYYGYSKYMLFNEVQNSHGDKAYEIRTYNGRWFY